MTGEIRLVAMLPRLVRRYTMSKYSNAARRPPVATAASVIRRPASGR
jgi:hypothetical protein